MANQRLTFEVGAEAVNVDQVKKKIQSIDDEITKLQKHAQDIRISEKGGTDIGKDLVKGIEKAIEELKGIQKSYTNILTGLSNQKIDTKQFEDFANSVNGRLEAVEKQVLGLEESLTKLVSRFEKKLPVQVLQGQVDSLTSRFNAFTESTDKAIRALSNFNDLVSKNTAKSKETTIKVDTSQLEKVETLIKKFETDDILGGNSNLTIRTDTAVKNLTELYEKYQSLSTELSKTKDAKQISSLQVQLAELLPEMAQIANRIMELKKLNIDDVYAGLGENISLGKLGNFAKIFEFIDNQIGTTSTRLAKMRDEMKTSLEGVTSEATTEVSQFTFKNGGIRVPVTIDASSKKALESKYNEIVSELQNYANVHPVNVTMRLFPLNTNRAGATEITNELKRIQTDINSVEDSELKVKLNSLYDDLEAQFKKALDLKIKVDLGDSTVSLKQRIKELQQAVKDEGFTIYPTFDISEEEAKKITSVLAKVQESASLDFNEEFRKTADALNKLTSNGDISKWSDQFAEGLSKAYAKLEEMQPLIQTLTFFFATKKSAKDSILSKTDVSSITALSQAINALQDAIEKIQTLDLSKLDNADFGQKIQSELSNMKPITIPIEPDLSNINSFITKLEDALSKANIDLNLGAKTQKSKSLQEYVQDKDVANAMYKDIYKRLDEVADNVGTPLKKKIAVSLVEGLRSGLSSVTEMLQEGLKGTKFESITDQLIGDKETIDGIKNVANEVAVRYQNALKESEIDVGDFIGNIQGQIKSSGQTVKIPISVMESSLDDFIKEAQSIINAKLQLESISSITPKGEDDLGAKQITSLNRRIGNLQKKIDSVFDNWVKFGQGAEQGTSTSIESLGKVISKIDELSEKLGTISEKFSDVKIGLNAEELKDKVKNNTSSSTNTNKSKKPKEYDEKTAVKGAQLIEAELNRQTQNLDFDGYITSIQRMYDSHDHLAQALITAERTIEDSTGELVKQTQKLNIKYDKNGGIAYTSTMEADNYKATANAAEKARKDAEKKQQALYKQMQKESADRINAEESQKQSAVNGLLVKQATAYKNVLSIRKQIAGLDEKKNPEQIEELEKQKQEQLEIYASTTRQLKAIDENANAEAQVNQLLEMRKKSIAEINALQAKQSDKEYNDYQNSITKGISQTKNLLAKGNYTSEYSSELERIESTLVRLQGYEIDAVTDKELAELKAAQQRLEELTRTANAAENKAINENTVSKSLGRINDILSKNTRLSFKNTDVYRDFVALQDAFKNFNTDRPQSELNELVKALNRTDAEFKALDDSVKGTGFFGNFIHRLSDMNAKFLATYFSFQDIVRYARSAFNAVQDLNKQMVELAKVSDQSLSQIQGDFSDYAKTAKGLGATISDTISATADWARFNKIDPLYGNI